MKNNIIYTVLAFFLFMIYPSFVLGATIGEDDFSRTQSNGWGTAQTGGVYTLVGNASTFLVNGDKGVIAFTFAGTTREAFLSSISQINQDSTVAFALSNVPTGGGYTVDLVGRRIDGNNSYRGRVDIKADGSVILRLIAVNGGAEQPIVSYQVPGLVYESQDTLFLRARFTGSNPTILDAKVWKAGTIEPDWQIEGVSNTVPALQASGAAGLRASSSSDANVLSVFFDEFLVTDGNYVNQPPVVVIGDDQEISLPNIAVLEAEVTDDDFPGNPIAISWTQIQGPPGGADLSSATVANPEVTFYQTGTYVFRINLDDGQYTTTETIQITVSANTSPTLEAGANQSINLPGAVAVLNATITDNAPDSYTRSWTVESAPAGATYAFSSATAEDPVFSFTNRTPGTYILRLTVDDGDFMVSDTLTLTLVLPDNTAPLVNAGTDQIVTLPDTATSVTASATDDGLPVSSEMEYLWELVSGPTTEVVFGSPTALSSTVTFTQGIPGTYVVRFAADDSDLSSADTITIQLQNNGPPDVLAGLPQVITLPSSVFLDSTVTDDGKLQPVTYSWSKQSGPGSVSFIPSHTVADPQASFSKAGSYVLLLTVSDGEYTETDTVHITVNPDPNAPSVVAPVYRFYSQQNQTHFYTASVQERDFIRNTYPERVWRYEDVAFQAFLEQQEDTVAIHRFYSRKNGSHFYTASEAERDHVIKTFPENVWKYEGIAWYAYPETVSGHNEMYRFWNTKQSKHFYTANKSERDHVISNLGATYRYEGVAYKVP